MYMAETLLQPLSANSKWTQFDAHFHFELRDFDGDPERVTEMDALVAYLQMTGTLVDFSTYEADDLENRR